MVLFGKAAESLEERALREKVGHLVGLEFYSLAPLCVLYLPPDCGHDVAICFTLLPSYHDGLYHLGA